MTPEEQAAVDAAKKGQNAGNKQADVATKPADDKALADKQEALNKTLADAKNKSDDALAAQKAAEDKIAAEKDKSDKKAKAEQEVKDQAEADAKKKEQEDKEAADKKAAEDKAAEAEQAKITKQVEEKRANELALANDHNLPPDFQRPSVGRIVHFYPNENDKQALENDVEFIAAIVTRVFGHHRVDLRIFPAVEEKNRFTRRINVPHKIKAATASGDDSGHWEWPGRV